MTHIIIERFIYKQDILFAMERKLIVQGKGGYTIYLPKKWVDKKKLKAGDTINIVEKDTSLIVGSAVKGKKQAVVELTNENKRDIGPILTHLYRRGFDSITVKGIDAKSLKEVKETTSNLLGFELTEKDDSYCTLENISEPTEAKYDAMLRRVFLIIKETQNIMLNDFENGLFKSMAEINDFRKQQDKFILFCRRILVKEKYEKDPMLEWELLTFLMHIEHAYYYLYKYCFEKKPEKDKNINEILRSLGSYLEMFYNSYFKKELKSVHKINNLKKDFQFGRCIALLEKSKGKNSVVMSYIRELFRLIQVGTSPVLSGLFEEMHY